MKKEQFDSLLDRYINNNASEEEKKIIDSWMEGAHKNKHYWYKMNDSERSVLLNRLFYDIRKRTIHKDEGSRVRRFRISWAGWAAVFLAALTAVTWYATKDNEKSIGEDIVQLGATEEGGKVHLEVIGKSKINLDPGLSGIRVDRSGVYYQDNDAHVSLPGQSGRVEMQSLSTDAGVNYSITLSDGTIVWLNAKSKLTFPDVFGDSSRNVSLSGEAFFDVARDESRPFIIETEDQEIQVLGTTLNIRSYANQATSSTLISGKARVAANSNKAVYRLLKNGETARVCNEVLQVESKDVEKILAWRDNKFNFQNESLYDVMDDISKWYGIRIQFSNNLKTKPINGVISRTHKLKAVFDAIAAINDIHMEYDEAQKIWNVKK